jgi:hypothetical protein
MKNQITAVIDADSIMWVVGYFHKDSTDSLKVINSVDEYVSELLTKVNATQYLAFIGGEGNFRKTIATHKPYKGNRPPEPEFMVKWKGIITHHLINKWGFVACNGIEADDAVSIAMNKLPELANPILCHIDKDLNQVPGNHYNYQKKVFYHVDEEVAWKTLLAQVLMGDGTDNIAGLPGVGEAKVSKFMIGTTYEECLSSVENGFIKYYAEHYGRIIFNETLSLVRTLTEEEYGFVLPTPIAWSPNVDLTEDDVASIDFAIFD